MKTRKEIYRFIASLIEEGKLSGEEGFALVCAIDFAGESIEKKSPAFKLSFGEVAEKVIKVWYDL